jgi:DNA-nicking Smr family endonuclease
MGQETSRPMTQQSASLVHQPFRVLNKLGAAVERQEPPPQLLPDPGAREPKLDGATLFLAAVADVTPLGARARERVDYPPPASPQRDVSDEDAEALAELCDLVTGSAPFDITDSDEYVEGAAAGLDPRLLRRLRAGEFAYQAHLDLHGMSSEQARGAVEAFLTRTYLDGKRCVLIVHGRGRNSKDQVPILKSRLVGWLARGQWRRLILAFTSARSYDGGAGALYVLLRRNRNQKRAIRVTEGARR